MTEPTETSLRVRGVDRAKANGSDHEGRIAHSEVAFVDVGGKGEADRTPRQLTAIEVAPAEIGDRRLDRRGLTSNTGAATAAGDAFHNWSSGARRSKRR